MKLLHEEKDNILKTRGSFNGMFSRKSDGASFSIDRPVKFSTMLASGFIVLKVSNATGEHLICGDVRKETEVGDIMPDSYEKFLAYMDVDADVEDADLADETFSKHLDANRTFRNSQKNAHERDQDVKVLLLREVEFSFKKVIGVYVQDSLFG